MYNFSDLSVGTLDTLIKGIIKKNAAGIEEMSNQVIFWDEMTPGYGTSQASGAEARAHGSPADPLARHPAPVIPPHRSWRERDPDPRNAQAHPNQQNIKGPCGQTAIPSEVKQWWFFLKCSVYAFWFDARCSSRNKGNSDWHDSSPSGCISPSFLLLVLFTLVHM